MSQENVEPIREMYAAWGRADIEWLIERSDPEIEIIQPPEVPDSKTYRGHAGVREAFDDWPKQWDDFRVELLDVIDVSDAQTISVTRHYLRARGIDMEQEVAYVHTARDGLARAAGCRSRRCPHENVEVVKVAYEVFAREGLDRFMEHFTDDVEYRVLAGAPRRPRWSDSRPGRRAGMAPGLDRHVRRVLAAARGAD